MGPLERAIADACLGARAGDAIAADLRGFLESHGVAPADIAAILEAPRRLAVYRSLVRNGISGVVQRVLPRTRARLNAASGGRFDADLASFVDSVGPRTHYLRDVPGELVAWAAPTWRSDPAVPPYVPDLAAHEIAEFAVATAESSGTPSPLAEVALERPIAFAGTARLERYAWAVHELPPELEATDPPVRRPVTLLAHRDDADAVRWLELTPLAADIVAGLLAGDALGSAVARACEGHGTAPPHVSVEVARLLADLGARGAILGAW